MQNFLLDCFDILKLVFYVFFIIDASAPMNQNTTSVLVANFSVWQIFAGYICWSFKTDKRVRGVA
jgi:hypothetical protein